MVPNVEQSENTGSEVKLKKHNSKMWSKWVLPDASLPLSCKFILIPSRQIFTIFLPSKQPPPTLVLKRKRLVQAPAQSQHGPYPPHFFPNQTKKIRRKLIVPINRFFGPKFLLRRVYIESHILAHFFLTTDVGHFDTLRL